MTTDQFSARTRRRRLAPISLLIGLLASLSPTAALWGEETLVLRTISKDFGGHWELDYGKSDRLDEMLQMQYLGSRREAQRGGFEDPNLRRRRRSGPTFNIGGRPISGGGVTELIQLGQFTDNISKIDHLEISHDRRMVQVKREEHYPLTCRFSQAKSAPSPMQETCGWDAHQLRFFVVFPGGFQIQHRLTLANDGEQLAVATAVYSPQFSAPFLMNRVYRRYEPLPDQFECEFTLAAGKTCRRVRVPVDDNTADG